MQHVCMYEFNPQQKWSSNQFYYLMYLCKMFRHISMMKMLKYLEARTLWDIYKTLCHLNFITMHMWMLCFWARCATHINMIQKFLSENIHLNIMVDNLKIAWIHRHLKTLVACGSDNPKRICFWCFKVCHQVEMQATNANFVLAMAQDVEPPLVQEICLFFK